MSKLQVAHLVAPIDSIESAPVPPAIEYPEDSYTLVQVWEEIAARKQEYERLSAEYEEAKAVMVRLYLRSRKLNSGALSDLGVVIEDPLSDRRKILNPEKNLKLSAKRSYGHSKEANLSPKAARQRAYDATMKAAKERYGNDPDIKGFIDHDMLPPDVLEYIDAEFQDLQKQKASETSTETVTNEPEPAQEIQA